MVDKLSKVQWDEILKVNRRTLFKVFLAGSAVGFIIGMVIAYVAFSTGFIL